MESKFHNPEEERPNAYASPLSHNELNETVARKKTGGNLCVRVQEMLPSLIEGDGDVRPEMATAIYGHLAVCPECAREFDGQQRVVSLIEQLPLLELPKDYSALVMQRVTQEMGVYKDGALQRRQASPALETLTSLGEAQTQAVASGTTLHASLTLTQRVVVTSILAALTVFFLATEWGRQTVGGNVDHLLSWLNGVGMAARSVPLLGQVGEAAVNALTQSAQLIRESYATLGATAARGLALDVALAGAVGAVYVKRQKPMHTLGH